VRVQRRSPWQTKRAVVTHGGDKTHDPSGGRDVKVARIKELLWALSLKITRSVYKALSDERDGVRNGANALPGQSVFGDTM